MRRLWRLLVHRVFKDCDLPGPGPVSYTCPVCHRFWRHEYVYGLYVWTHE